MRFLALRGSSECSHQRVWLTAHPVFSNLSSRRWGFLLLRTLQLLEAVHC